MVLAKTKERAIQIRQQLSPFKITAKEWNENGEIDYLNVTIKEIEEDGKVVAYIHNRKGKSPVKP